MIQLKRLQVCSLLVTLSWQSSFYSDRFMHGCDQQTLEQTTAYSQR